MLQVKDKQRNKQQQKKQNPEKQRLKIDRLRQEPTDNEGGERSYRLCRSCRPPAVGPQWGRHSDRKAWQVRGGRGGSILHCSGSKEYSLLPRKEKKQEKKKSSYLQVTASKLHFTLSTTLRKSFMCSRWQLLHQTLKDKHQAENCVFGWSACRYSDITQAIVWHL